MQAVMEAKLSIEIINGSASRTGGDPSRSLPGPENIERCQLTNGMALLSRWNPNSGSVFISGSLLAGGLFDLDEKLGLAFFTSSALMRGTKRRSFFEIYNELESIGASLGFSGGTHTVSFYGKSLVEDVDLLLELLSQALQQPVFPQEQVERLRSQLLTSLAIRAQDTSEVASLAFDQIVYANHPYRRPEDGYLETIQAIRQEDLCSFHHKHYGPQGMLIAVVGGIQPDLAMDKVRKVFDEWRNPEQPFAPALPAPIPLSKNTRKHVEVEGKSQSDLIIGTTGPPRSSPDFMAASLGNHVLGQFGMMGRLGELVREQAGIAYSVSSSLSGGLGPGPWDISAGVHPENIDQAIELIIQEIRRFVSEPISADELADSQTNYIGRLPISLESNAGIASALLSLERHDLGLDYYLRYADLVKAVTPEKVLEAAARYLDPEKLAIVSAGSSGDHHFSSDTNQPEVEQHFEAAEDPD